MASGSWTKTISGSLALIVEWSSTPNTSANTSNVSVTVKLQYWTLSISAREDNYVSINGTKYYFDSSAISKTSASSTTTKTLTTKTATVAHNSDGTKSISIGAAFNLNATISGVNYGTVSTSKTVTLDEIARKATIDSAPNFTQNDNPTITYTNSAGSAVTSLKACISLEGTAADIPYRDISKTGSSYTFNLTSTELQTLYNATTGSNSRTVYFYVMTELGGEQYYSKLQRTFTIVDGEPIITVSVYDTDSTTKALTGDNTKLIKHYSDARCNFTASGVNGSTIVDKKITCGTQTVTMGASATNRTITDVTSGTFVFTATDSRGNTATKTVTRTMVAYIPVTCNLKTGTPTADGNLVLNIYGNYFSGSFGASNNTLRVQYRLNENDAGYGSWITVSGVTGSGGIYSVDVSLTGLNYQSTYAIQARAVDKLDTALSAEQKVNTLPLFDWGENDFNFNTNITMRNATALSGTNPAGNQRSMVQLDANGNYYFGHGGYANEEGRTYYDGDYVYIRSNHGVYVNGKKLADFPYISGETGIWKYWKYANGWVIASGRYEFSNKDISTAFGNLYYPGGGFNSIALPMAAANTDTMRITATPRITSGGLYTCHVSGVTTSSVSFLLGSARSETGKSGSIEILAIYEYLS